jgi:hypothetical protein
MSKQRNKILGVIWGAGFYVSNFTPIAMAQWVSCHDRQVWIDQPLISDQGYDVHYTAGEYLVFQDSMSQDIRHCFLIGPGWMLKGFQSVDTGPHSDEQTIIFAINRDLESRYFDMRDGKEVYLHQIDAHLFITDQAEEKPGTKVDILKNAWFDHVSKVAATQYHRVTNRGNWYSLWKLHRGRGEAVPHVDFDADMVIAVFTGEQSSNDRLGVRLAEIREDRKKIYIYYFLETAAVQEEPMPNFQPCAFYVIPRSSKKVVIFEGKPSKIGGPIQWLQVWEED